ncbi:hypothetical protein Q7C18_02665 [Nesterenkonia sp. CL21]|uniref:hypothetical protein n=1 Tax=Nesterenkonia sp. CL21 TaxID=3064894 RepID=UPI00287A2300|nr:hypothetical protein [Nesterenkonia sp. CL21]MDS2171591.1 hypothetical protein [Nesterenkonia sp. CL21]
MTEKNTAEAQADDEKVEPMLGQHADRAWHPDGVNGFTVGLRFVPFLKRVFARLWSGVKRDRYEVILETGSRNQFILDGGWRLSPRMSLVELLAENEGPSDLVETLKFIAAASDVDALHPLAVNQAELQRYHSLVTPGAVVILDDDVEAYTFGLQRVLIPEGTRVEVTDVLFDSDNTIVIEDASGEKAAVRAFDVTPVILAEVDGRDQNRMHVWNGDDWTYAGEAE